MTSTINFFELPKHIELFACYSNDKGDYLFDDIPCEVYPVIGLSLLKEDDDSGDTYLSPAIIDIDGIVHNTDDVLDNFLGLGGSYFGKDNRLQEKPYNYDAVYEENLK